MFDKYYVIDTNIILENASNIIALSQESKNLIILPETVLDEIDTKKSGFEEINFQSREFARLLENHHILQNQHHEDANIISIELHAPYKVRVDIISKKHYSQSSEHARNIINDRKILEIASFAKNFYQKEMVFISMDVMARMRALSLNLQAQSLVGKQEDFDYEFIKTHPLSFEDSNHLENKDVFTLNAQHKAHNFSYCFDLEDSDRKVLAVVQNDKIKLLDEIDLRRQIITPLNLEQLYLSQAIIDNYYDIVAVEAKAGSGKTLLALSGAIRLVKKKEYKKIVYIRNSIESLDKGEDVGYLPGMEEKFKIYNHPLMDSLDFIVRTDYKKTKENRSGATKKELDEQEVPVKVAHFIEKYAIETMWVGEMRGRTISNAVVIIDEAQNMSNKTMQMVLSRLDNSCKVIILGSNKQIDNFYVNKHTNALTTLLRATEKKSDVLNLFALRLEKVLRGPITEWAEDIFGV